MRDAFVKKLVELAEKDKNIELIVGDVGFGVMQPFWEKLPDQFTDAGIAEQNMMSLAAGMAREGKTVFVYSIGNFPTLRCLEQIRNDCAYHKANVKIVCVGGGLVYGSLGMSHQATEDLAILRALPGVTVFAPGDPAEAEAVTKAMVGCPGTCYMRLGRGGEPTIHKNEIADFPIGKALKVRDGKEIALLSTGGILGEAQKAVDLLREKGISSSFYSFPTVKPIDRGTIVRLAQECEMIVTCEEHNIVGGFGSAVAEVLAGLKCKARLLRIGLEDVYCTQVGTQNHLREKYGLSREGIIANVLRNYQSGNCLSKNVASF